MLHRTRVHFYTFFVILHSVGKLQYAPDQSVSTNFVDFSFNASPKKNSADKKNFVFFLEIIRMCYIFSDLPLIVYDKQNIEMKDVKLICIFLFSYYKNAIRCFQLSFTIFKPIPFQLSVS